MIELLAMPSVVLPLSIFGLILPFAMFKALQRIDRNAQAEEKHRAKKIALLMTILGLSYSIVFLFYFQNKIFVASIASFYTLLLLYIFSIIIYKIKKKINIEYIMNNALIGYNVSYLVNLFLN